MNFQPDKAAYREDGASYEAHNEQEVTEPQLQLDRCTH